MGKIMLFLGAIITEMMTICATLLAKEFNPTHISRKLAIYSQKILLINGLICGAFTNFIPILTVAKK